MTKPTITDETPCFYINVYAIDRDSLGSGASWYFDGTREEAEKDRDEYIARLEARGSRITRKICVELTERERYDHRHPRKSVIDWQSVDCRSF